MSLSFVPLGVGDAFARAYYSSSLLLTSGKQRLLIDCPHPIRKMMAEAHGALDVADVDGVVLTHLHADHVSGLEGFAYFNHFVLRRRTPLLALAEVAGPLWPGHLEVSMAELIDSETNPLPRLSFGDYFDWVPLAEDAAVTFGPFTVECRRTVHHIQTTALRITAGGRTLGYSADTAFDPTLIEWLSPADLIVHETNFGAHTPYEKLAALPAKLRARMRLIHYPDGFEATDGAIEMLRQGALYEV
jgi:ribonuclease BN (tRNA processing enzyme)